MFYYAYKNPVNPKAKVTEEVSLECLMNKLYNRAIEGELYHREASSFYHCKGYQGFKRYHRFQGREDSERANWLQAYAVDNFRFKLKICIEHHTNWEDVCFEKFFECYLAWEEETLCCLEKAKTELVKQEEYDLVDAIQKFIHAVTKEIKQINRWITEFDAVEWEPEYMFMVSKELHEKMKLKEKECHGRDIK